MDPIEQINKQLRQLHKKNEEVLERDAEDLTDEDIQEVEDRNEKIEKLKQKREALKKAKDGVDSSKEPESRDGDPPPRPNINSGVDPEGQRSGDQAFRSVGEFISELYTNPHSERMQEYREMSSTSGAEGAVLIPEEFRPDIKKIEPQEAIVRPNAQVIPPGDSPDAAVSFPAMQQGSKGVHGGVEVNWTATGEEMDETDGPKLDNITLEPQEVTATLTVDNKLLRNTQQAEQFAKSTLRKAMIAEEDYQYLQGDGTGKPLGIGNSDGVKKVARNTSADIKYEDINNMLKSLLPTALNDARWVATQSAFTQLKDMKDGSGNRIYEGPNLVKGRPATLEGIPLTFTGRLPVLGKTGDLMLIAPNYYLIKDGYGIEIAISEHVEFKSNKSVIKIVWNTDGQSWVKEPLTLKDGETKVSPFVALD